MPEKKFNIGEGLKLALDDEDNNELGQLEKEGQNNELEMFENEEPKNELEEFENLNR